MDDLQRRSLPAAARSLHRHGLLDARHGRREKHCRNGIPLYRQLPDLNADDLARQFNIVAKHSLEKIAAANHDCFCTVSDITARECRYLLGREPDEVTPNGFEDDFVWQGAMFDRKRAEARRLLISVAEAASVIHSTANR